MISFFGELGCQNMVRGGTGRCVGGVGWGGLGPLGRAPGWSGRAGRPRALYWVPLRALTSCLSAGSGNRWSSVLVVRSASRSRVLLRSLVAAVCYLASCNGKVVSIRIPGLHSSFLRAPRCSRDYIWRPDCRSWGPGHSRGCTPSVLPVSKRPPGAPHASGFSVAWAFLSGS